MVILTGLSMWSLCIHTFTDLDIFIFIFWFILALFPIISEISLFGINVKKDIQEAKDEIKRSIAEIKNNVVINNYVKASKEEYRNKTIEEIEDEIKESGDVNETEQKKETRLQKTQNIEKIVFEKLKKEFDQRFAPEIKVSDGFLEEMVLDGVSYDTREDGGREITKIFEIKFITRKSVEKRLKFIVLEYIKRINKVLYKVPPVEFIVVSEGIDQNLSKKVKSEIESNHITIRLFNYQNNVLTEI